MKKLISLLLAVLMLLAVTAPAMAYEAVTPSNAKIVHTLTLTEPEATHLAYNITYEFAVTQTPDILLPTGEVDTSIVNKSYAVEGYPTIPAAVYTPDSDFDSDKQAQTELTIALDGVKIKEPGIYRWKVTKTKNTNAPGDLTNNSDTAYVYVYATHDTATGLSTSVFYSSKDITDAGINDNKGNIGDEYPAKTLDLSIAKTVTGNMGSRDQYFKFTVSLTTPTGVSRPAYTVTITEEGNPVESYSIPVSAYNSNENLKNPSSIPANENTFDLWLKHGQEATIENLVFDTGYTITETANTGYDVSWTVNNSAATESSTATGTLTDTAAAIAFTNNKQSEVPTGIELQTIAPIMGILLAAGMMMILFAGKKKETVR